MMLTVDSPIWNKHESIYSFKLTGAPLIMTRPHINFTKECLPDTFTETVTDLLSDFLNKTQSWFASPLKLDSTLRRLQHRWPPTDSDSYVILTLRPEWVVMSSKEVILHWNLVKSTPSEPFISASFLESTTPRPQSPVSVPVVPVPVPMAKTLGSEPQETTVRTIQIQNTVDSVDGMVPVNDLPLSDILEIESNTKGKILEKQRIREARLKVALAKLKAERMAQKYYMKYGDTAEEDEGSELSSESDSDEHEDFTGR